MGMLRSASSRLAALYTAAFALLVVLLGLVALMITRAALIGQFDAWIAADSAAMMKDYRATGLPGLVAAIHRQDATPGALDVGLQSPDGRAVAGALAGAKTLPGWGDVIVSGPAGVAGPSRILTTVYPDGYRLLVGDDLDRISAVDGLVVRSFTIAFIGVLLLGAGGGYALHRDMHKRVSAITRTAQAIIDGDLASRVPVETGDEELQQLSQTLNRMLDRISGLMENLRQVSSDVAHELRTPLTRLRQRLEDMIDAAALSMGGGDERLEAALGDLDTILATFAALLRIAQVEGGGRRVGFRPVDLAVLAEKVVEAFRPAAEDAGLELSVDAPGPLAVSGDGELLTQMLANLVENAIVHASVGKRARVVCRRHDAIPVISVIDHGPGAPEAERHRLFTRFRRLEQSRSTPGLGLGLAMVAAVAKLHGATAELLEVAGGLEARVTFRAG